MKPLKNRHLQIYAFIDEYIQKYTYPPSYREIAKGVGLSSSSTVKGHLDRMQRNGHIEFIPSRSRTIRLVK